MLGFKNIKYPRGNYRTNGSETCRKWSNKRPLSYNLLLSIKRPWSRLKFEVDAFSNKRPVWNRSPPPLRKKNHVKMKEMLCKENSRNLFDTLLALTAMAFQVQSTPIVILFS